MIYRFADLQLDTGRRLLTRNGQAVNLTNLCFEVLKVLVEAAPDLVSHDELINRVWGPNRVVTPENLAQRIHILRDSLGDDATNPTYIEGVRGQGFRLIPKVEADSPQPETDSSLRRRLWLPAGVAIVIVWLALERGVEPLLGPDPQSIAVLPFKNIGGDPNNEYMSDGIAEELMNALAQVQELRVTAQTSSFAFKDQAVDIRTIAEELGVAHVLEGSVRVAGDKLRITAQLIESKDGTHEWSETYERELQDVFAIQDDITKNVVSALATILGITLEPPIRSGSTHNMEAYTHFLRGNHIIRRIFQGQPPPTNEQVKGAYLEAVSHFKSAIELDPQFGDAYAALADAYFWGAGWEPDGDKRREMRMMSQSIAEKAVSVSPDSSEAFRLLARLSWGIHRPALRLADDNLENQLSREMEQALRRALQLDPSNAEAMIDLAWAVMDDDPEEALELARRAMKLDPLNFRSAVTLAEPLWRTGRLKEAAETWVQLLAMRRGSLSTTPRVADELTDAPINVDFQRGAEGWRMADDCRQGAELSALRLPELDRKVVVAKGGCDIKQSFLARPYHDKYIRLAVNFKVKGVDTHAFLRMIMMGNDGRVNYQDGRHEPVWGDSEWLERQLPLYVPEQAVVIAVEVQMWGSGEIWMDDLRVEIADNPDFENAIRIGESD